MEHVLRNIASNATCQALAQIASQPWRFSTFGPYGLSYQKCRLCERSSESVSGLWKYGVRHYACDDCRKHYAQFSGVLTGTKKPE